jgi:hypothetical protein
MKRLLIILLTLCVNIGIAQEKQIYKYTIGVVNVSTKAEAKSLIDPIREAAKCKIVQFIEETHRFEFKSNQDLSEDKFIDIFNLLGYNLESYERLSMVSTSK